MEKELEAYLRQCRPIANEYRRSKEEMHRDAFNVFYLVSELYYRENFHSDIMSFLLNPNEKHQCGDAFLRAFIQMLNKTGKNIDPDMYRDATAVREEGKIDILITSILSKRAIIIENKINNAVDMEKQIPRYYDKVSKDYTIDAIVYLPLSDYKKPDMQDWTKQDKANIDPLLVTIPAYNKSGAINIVDDWLRPSILLSDNLDVVSTLRQYSNLITKLNHDIMDINVLEKFYNKLLLENNMETAQSIRDMMKELPEYMAKRIFETYRNGKKFEPFSKVDMWKDHACTFFEKAKVGEHSITIDVYCGESGYELWLFEREKELSVTDYDFIVNQINSFSRFEKKPIDDGYRGYTQFRFDEEKELFDYIDGILADLKSI